MDDEEIRIAKLLPQNQPSRHSLSPKVHTATEWASGAENSPSAQECHPYFEIPSIDRKVLDRIRLVQSRGNPGLMENVLGLYLQEAPRLVNLLRTALDGNDIQGMQQAAHTLKSCSANLGAIRLASLCREVEALAYSEAPSKAAPLVTSIEAEYPKVRSALEAEN